MLKRKLGLALAVVASVFLFLGCPSPITPPDDGVLKEDVTVGDEGLTNMNLDGHTVTVKNGTTLSNITNGDVVIETEGDVKINNGTDLNVTVKANAKVILDSDTKLKKLTIDKSAKKATVSSAKAERNRAARAAGREAEEEPADGSGEPVIENLVVDSTVELTLDGGNVSNADLTKDGNDEAEIIISKDSTAVVEDLKWIDNNGNALKDNTEITVDQSYEGEGIKLDIKLKRSDALVREVARIKDGVWMGIEWNEAAAWNNDKDKVFEKEFIYKYLTKDFDYKIVVRFYKPLYVDSNGNFSGEKILISSNTIDVRPKSGIEVSFDCKGSELVVENGIMHWNSSADGFYPVKPVIDITEGTEYINYGLWSVVDGEGKWIGEYNFPITGSSAVDIWQKEIDIYENFSISNIDSINSESLVYVNATYKYAGFSWDITSSKEFRFNKDLYPQIADVGTDNIIKFTKGADAIVLKGNADGYYLWAYAGKKGAYIAYEGRPKADTTIDMNVVIESDPVFKQAIIDNNNLYSINLSWYKKDDSGNNQYVATLADKANLHYTAQAEYEPAHLTIEREEKITITKPSDALLDSYKKTVGDDAYIVLEAFNEDGNYMWFDQYGDDASNPFRFKLSKLEIDGEVEITGTPLLKMFMYIAQNMDSKKYTLRATLKNNDDTVSMKIAEGAGSLATSGWELPSMKVENNILFIEKPGKKYIEAFKALGADRFRLQVADKAYCEPDDRKWFYFSDENPVDSFNEKFDLVALLWDRLDEIKANGNKIWICWVPAKEGDWVSGIPTAPDLEAELDIAEYISPVVETSYDAANKAVTFKFTTKPNDAYLKLIKDRGPDQYAVVLFNGDKILTEEGYWDERDWLVSEDVKFDAADAFKDITIAVPEDKELDKKNLCAQVEFGYNDSDIYHFDSVLYVKDYPLQ